MRRRGTRWGRWAGAVLALGLLGLLLVPTIQPPPLERCGADGPSGDVQFVGSYPRPQRFGPYTMYPEQLVFADVVAKRLGWNAWVIRAQILHEQNGPAAVARVRARNNNWLNVGYFDALAGAGAYQSSTVWQDPVRAGNATADWVQGKRETINSKASDRIRQAYERGAGRSPQVAIGLLQRSGWATSGYPLLPRIYASLTRDAERAPTTPTTVMASTQAAPSGNPGSTFDAAVDAAKTATGQVGFALVDEQGRLVAGYHPERVNTGRSMSKALILVALLQRAKDRALTGQERALADRMIRDSDNVAANTLLSRVSRRAVDQVARRVGMRQWDPTAGRGRAIAYRLGTAAVSAQDFARLFAQIDRLIPTRHRSYGTGVLGSIRGAGRYGALDAGFSGAVLSKGGWNVDGREGTVNQAAQITVGGRTYGFAVVLGGQSSLEGGGRQIATIARAIADAEFAAGPTGCGDAPASGPTGERIAQIASKYVGRNGRAQPFEGFQPPTFQLAWCAWFSTNVWRRAGVDIPVNAFSAYHYIWAKAKHPELLFKDHGRPSRGKVPPLGSAIAYGTGPSSAGTSQHVNLVSKVNADGSYMIVGGNQGNSRVTTQGPCRLAASGSRQSGPGCDSRPIWSIVAPPGGDPV
ncbi:MAG: class A beta-lactamase-related serine hydrolase [Solirubrobacteraceae bacterium]|nr:class A beta-lactamase-related serine hydrolase [Solirubrobacteraceae bacterium]